MPVEQVTAAAPSEEPVVFVVGLGANIGEPLAQLRRAVSRLRELRECEVVSISPVYCSAPVGPPQPDFLNAAVRLNSTLEPLTLLRTLQRLEAEEGRTRDLHWGPRTLDLDILWSQRVCGTAELQIPHPRLRERWWALRPLLDVVPELTSEYGVTLSGLGPVPIPLLML